MCPLPDFSQGGRPSGVLHPFAGRLGHHHMVAADCLLIRFPFRARARRSAKIPRAGAPSFTPPEGNMTLHDYQTQIDTVAEQLRRHKRGQRLAQRRLRDLNRRALTELSTAEAGALVMQDGQRDS